LFLDTIVVIQLHWKLFEIPNGRNRTLHLPERLASFSYQTDEEFDFHDYANGNARYVSGWQFHRDKSVNLYEHSENICFISVRSARNDRNLKYKI
jgi:hypothetical protein